MEDSLEFKPPQPKLRRVYNLADWLDPSVAAQARGLLGRLGMGDQYSFAPDRPTSHTLVSMLHYVVRHAAEGRPNDALALVFYSIVGEGPAVQMSFKRTMQEFPYVSGMRPVLSSLNCSPDLRSGERFHYLKFYVTKPDGQKFQVLHLSYEVDSEANDLFLMQPHPGTMDNVATGYQEWAGWPFGYDEVKIDFVIDEVCVGPHDMRQMQLE